MNSQLLPLRSLTGFGRSKYYDCSVFRPEKMASFISTVKNFGQKTLISRGLGRSYGDAAVNDQGAVILSQRLDRILEFDQSKAVLKAESGVCLARLLAVFVPQGFAPKVLPGTKYVSLGGALAADIHGKNHHVDGTFTRHVRQFNLIDGLSNQLTCSRQDNSEAFFATAGGMGLTGLITDIQIEMQKIPSAFIANTCLRADNLDGLFEAFQKHESKHQFSVAWIDCLARGDHLGRGVLFLGDYAAPDMVSMPQAHLSWSGQNGRRFGVPTDAPQFLLNRFTVGAFNELFYRLQKPRTEIVHMDRYFFPLDSIDNWNRLYGKDGFIQYQCVIPTESSAAGLRELLTCITNRGWGSFLAVLKRFGESEVGNHASLSFPCAGYTLALDFPVRNGLLAFISELNKIVISHHGRLYLAKDSCLAHDDFQAMYPHAGSWQQIRNQLDPQGVFSSVLSRRLGLTN